MGKTVLITGGEWGFGKATARHFFHQGSNAAAFLRDGVSRL